MRVDAAKHDLEFWAEFQFGIRMQERINLRPVEGGSRCQHGLAFSLRPGWRGWLLERLLGSAFAAARGTHWLRLKWTAESAAQGQGWV